MQAEIDHVRNALRANKYEEWALNVPISKPHKMDNNNKHQNQTFDDRPPLCRRHV